MGFGLNLTSGGGTSCRSSNSTRAPGVVFRVDRERTPASEAGRHHRQFRGCLRFRRMAKPAGLAFSRPGARFRHGADWRTLPPEPSKNHRQGVRLRLMLSSTAAGGTERLREVTRRQRASCAASRLSTINGSPDASRTREDDRREARRREAVVSGGGGQKVHQLRADFHGREMGEDPGRIREAPGGRHPARGGAVPRIVRAKAVRRRLPPATQPPRRHRRPTDDWG